MPAAARPASTVLVVRDGSRGVEVYLQRRPLAMHFAGGLWVFPGGRVDDADRDPAIDAHLTGPRPTAWAAILDVPIDLARGHLVSACRETFEESGILLADASPPADQVSGARRALLDGDRSMVDVVADLGVRLNTDLLRYWAWWVTPASEPRRYDTRFFIARLPDRAATTPHDDEVVEERWAARDDVDEFDMVAPTFYTLRDAVAHARVDDLLATAERRPIDAVQPTIEDRTAVLPTGERFPLPTSFGS